MISAELLNVTDQYLDVYPDEAAGLTHLRRQLEAGEKLNDRKNFIGHIAGSGIVLLPDKSKILLIYHKAYDKWMQPGGHWDDGEASPLAAAEREVNEETGVTDLRYVPIDPANPLVPLHVETHHIKPRPEKNEPEHWHHDFRYAFIAGSETLTYQEAEVKAAEWFILDAPEAGSMQGMIAKLRAHDII